MDKIPWNVYDFFAYISSGSIILAAIDFIYGQRWLLQGEHTVVFSIFVLFLAYVCGHVIAHLSSWLIENSVRNCLGQPSEILMNSANVEKHKSRYSGIFRKYYKALEDKTRHRIVKRLQERDFKGEGQALFDHVSGVVQQNTYLTSRLDIFLNLYGFARNMSISFLVVAMLVFFAPTEKLIYHPSDNQAISAVDNQEIGEVDNGISGAMDNDSSKLAHEEIRFSQGWAGVFVFLSVIMFYRYLKFYRRYTYELLIGYSEMVPESPKECDHMIDLMCKVSCNNKD